MQLDWQWTCGHVAGAMCAECYRELARRAHELSEENDRLRERLQEITGVRFVRRQTPPKA